MRIAVLGGAGFIGSNFVRHILGRMGGRAEVLVYDKLTYAGRLENLSDVIERIEFVKGDIANGELLSHVLKEFKPDAVVNFAAETHVDRSINEPSPFVRTNIFGVFTVLEVVKELGIPVFVHISTDEVYGDLAGTDEAADESWPLNPSSPYSASKASGDMLIKAYGRTYGLPYRIVRPCNNYGPYEHPEKLIPRTVARLLHGKKATIYGDGKQVRDWLYVGDFAEALASIIEKGRDGEVYNVCAQHFATVGQIVESIVRMMGRDPASEIIYVRGRPGEDRRYAMRCDKVRELGWRPSLSLEEGLRKTVHWYLSNEHWWKPLVDRTYILEDEPWRAERK